jgi:glycine/D-amino acid oxidase-like deaminating enzyme
MKKFYMAALTGLLVSFTVVAQQNDSITLKKISDDIMTRGVAYENLRFICKKIGPRLSGSAQGAKAVKETARMMREMGADTVYLQECMVPHWVRGEKEAARLILANGKAYPLKAAALGNSVGTPAAGITSTVIEIRNWEELNAQKDNLKGKIVFFNFPMNPTYVRTFQAYGEAGAYRGNGPEHGSKIWCCGCGHKVTCIQSG